VDDRLLLDGGAPLLPHMHRLGIDPGGIEALFLTHFHGDHVLGLPPYLFYRGFSPSGPLLVIGPPGVRDRVDQLCRLAWGAEWPEHAQRIPLIFQEAAPSGTAAGVDYEAVKLDHGGLDCRGYRLHLDGRVLAYAGDTIASPPLDELVRGAAVAITEATSPADTEVHTSWDQAAALAARHPQTRFIFNHLFAGTIPGAAEDLQVIEA
jgi:ribonuclease BN (tRNA processing enzyme)